MFTGLIEAVCQVRTLRQSSDGMEISIDLADIAKDTNIGDSIAVNGVCLTVTKINGQQGTFDCHPETLEKSALGKLKPAGLVNIERAMPATGRFGGHFVQGHIDGTAKIQALRNKGQFREIDFSASSQLLDQMIEKGSIAVNGISLTIAGLNKEGFSIAVIPQTWDKTTLHRGQVGDFVNIEIDIIVKAVRNQLKKNLPDNDNLTEDKLGQMGF